MFRTGAAGGGGGSGDQPFPDERPEQKVHLPLLRIYLVLLNILSIAFTALLQIGNTPVLFVFRILQGVVAGMYMNFIPTYIGELTPK